MSTDAQPISEASSAPSQPYVDDPVREWRLIQILADSVPLSEADREDLEFIWRLRFEARSCVAMLSEQELTRFAAASDRIMAIAEKHYSRLALSRSNTHPSLRFQRTL